MNKYLLKLLLITLILFPAFVKGQNVQLWLTNTDKSVLFQKQKDLLHFSEKEKITNVPSIYINEKKTFQTMDGFGFALTGSSASLIQNMDAPARDSLLSELFSTEKNHIGASYIRVSIGASDLSDHAFSYDDLQPGKTDPKLKKFNLGPDLRNVVPVLAQILGINPKIKILGSPWSAPAWMKTNQDTRGGSLAPNYYDVYAEYLVDYVNEMKKEGIPIDAITVQNEPLNPENNPSMLMTAREQSEFIKNHLGPDFKAAGIKTKIILYDHNADRPDYPISILNNPEAAKYIDGSAFHLYGGSINALTSVHNAFPNKNLYFTEQWVGAPGNFASDLPEHINKLIIGASRNWCKTIIEWNLASDPHYNPHTDRGGCDRCLGAVTINGNQVIRNPAYYIIAHAAKFVRPGSVRIASNPVLSFANVAFETPGHKKVLIVINNSQKKGQFAVHCDKKIFYSSLNAGSVGTYIW